MIELALFRTFIAVAETGGFRRASERLNLTQSSVSQQIKRLEQMLGRDLFQRDTRHVALTHDGEMLLNDARRLVRLEEEIRQRLTGPLLTGMVRLGAVEEVASTALPPLLGRFARRHPEVRIEVVVGVSAELIELVDRAELDLALAKRPWGTSRGRLLWREPMVWAAADGFELPPNGSVPLALYRGSSVTRVAALEALRRTQLPWHIVYTSPSLTGVRAAALAGFAVTPLPRSALGKGLRTLGEAHAMPPLPELEFALFTRPTPDAAAAELAELLSTLGSPAENNAL